MRVAEARRAVEVAEDEFRVVEARAEAARALPTVVWSSYSAAAFTALMAKWDAEERLSDAEMRRTDRVWSVLLTVGGLAMCTAVLLFAFT